MKVAVCMSGLARTFRKCYQSYLDNIINLYDCDVFTVVASDENAKYMDLIKQTRKIIVENEPIHDEKDYAQYKDRLTRKYSIKGWLSQFWKIKICHNLMLDYQKEKNIQYDWVIRCRPDLMIMRKIDDLNKLNKEYFYIPVFPSYSQLNHNMFYEDNYVHDFGRNKGFLPDQFAIGSVDLMTIYARRYDDLDRILSVDKIKFCSERSLGDQLKMNGVKVKLLKPLVGIQRTDHVVK